MTKTFHHTFSDGSRIRLDFDMATNPISVEISRHMLTASDAIKAEFRTLMEHVVSPEVLAACNPEQVATLAKYGAGGN